MTPANGVVSSIDYHEGNFEFGLSLLCMPDIMPQLKAAFITWTNHAFALPHGTCVILVLCSGLLY